ncbi:Tc1-like transposase [Histomonas meleagridis]|uniref:Tc1-like transposase n=1 Tax=Histomonas meleagridis TaxID=135588 RepID=UPI00355A0859|nr:Tc1-like transposase [Histomonas meleagridis]KAH0803734.1 Tc1-like transposase [Histomonas meleagridis]
MKIGEPHSFRVDPHSQFRYHFVAMNILKDPSITNRTISSLSCDYEFKMSESTVERISAAIGFKAKYQQPKEKLTENKKVYRVRFAKEIPKTLPYLLPWCSSDECIIALEPYKRKVRVFPGIQCDEQYYEKEGYPFKIMVGECISKEFKSNLMKIEGNLNAEFYQKMLAENQIFEKLNDRFGPKCFVFQQDEARPHTAKSTKLYLEGRVTMLPDDLHWPSSSPDLNVIEICWSIIKSKINYQEIHTADDLYRAASEA